MSHSLEVKKLSIEYIKNGHSFEELKENYKVSRASYYNWKKQQENGILDQKKVQKRRRKIDLKKLEQALERKPDATLFELAKIFKCTEQAVFYALKRAKLTLKKNFVYEELNRLYLTGQV